MSEITSRQRLLRAINLQEADHVPCCFMSFRALRDIHHEDWFKVALAERDMGLDVMFFIPATDRPLRRNHPDLRGLPIRFHPSVSKREWREKTGEGVDYLYKEYLTPAGKLSTHIRLTEDWPHGDTIPFVDDYQVPRSTKPLITGPQDLEALGYLLTPPEAGDIVSFRKDAETAHAFVNEHGFLLSGGWGGGNGYGELAVRDGDPDGADDGAARVCRPAFGDDPPVEPEAYGGGAISPCGSLHPEGLV